MWKRAHTKVATVVLSGALACASTAYAQAPLDLTIDPTEGVPGDIVSAQVDPADVAASCVTDLVEFQARFQAVLEGPYAGGSAEGELFSRFFPGGEFVFETCDQAAYSLTGITILAIGANIQGAAETALPQTFALTFAEIATQEPVGQLSTFDPVTGQGTVVVPDVDPGLWAVAAACVAPVLDIDQLEAGIRENGAFLESLGFPTCDINDPAFADYVKVLLGEDADLFTFLNAFGPTFIQSIVTPEALGVQFFTILEEPGERVAGVIADIEALVAAGELKEGQARALIQVLTNALRSLEGGRMNPACKQLSSFAKVATAKVKAKALTEAQAAELIAEVESISEQLGCAAPVGSPSGAFLDGYEMHF